MTHALVFAAMTMSPAMVIAGVAVLAVIVCAALAARRLAAKRASGAPTTAADEHMEAPTNIRHRLMSLATAADEPAAPARARQRADATTVTSAASVVEDEQAGRVAVPGYSTGPLPALPPSPTRR